VPGRLEYRTEHPLHSWLATELVRRFDHRCCDSISELETINRETSRYCRGHEADAARVYFGLFDHLNTESKRTFEAPAAGQFERSAFVPLYAADA
jgi:CRISPR/Cas system-associated endonuclease Cas1